MGSMASQITSLTIVYSAGYSDADQRKHQSSASLAIVRGIHWWPVNSLHKWPVTRKMFPFDDVIMPMTLCWIHSVSWISHKSEILAFPQTTFMSTVNTLVHGKGDSTLQAADLIEISNVLFQVIDWYRMGDKPSPEPVMKQLSDTYGSLGN